MDLNHAVDLLSRLGHLELYQDSSVSCAAESSGGHSLANLLNKPKTTTTATKSEPVITPYARFANRLIHKKGRATEEINAKRESILSDPATIEYLNHLKNTRNNQGEISRNTIEHTTQAIRQFMEYTNLSFNGHAVADLVQYKRNNPTSTDIEQALRAFSLELPIKTHHNHV